MNNNNILNTPVSVIIPAYNADKYIVDAVDSLINQSVKPKEIIIIDDGSTDNTKNIILEKYKDNSLIKIFSQENKGLGEARDRGISLCTGDYVFCCDSDDIVLPGLFEEFNNKLQENKNMDMFCFNTYLFFENGTIKTKGNHQKSGWVKNGWDVAFDLISRESYTSAAWTYILRREIIIQNKLKFIRRIHEDHNFTMNAYLTSQATYRTKNFFYSVRVRQGSLTRSKINIDFVINRINAFKGTLDILDKIEDSQNTGNKFFKEKYINISLLSIVDMCIESYVFLPGVVIDTFKLYRNNPSHSWKEKILLNSPTLYFFLKKTYMWSKKQLSLF
jgi:glycosyltransferase involved in cell wall biosynthesis